MKRGIGAIKKIFQRVVMVSLSLLIQLVVFALMIWKFQDENDVLAAILILISVVVALVIIDKNTNPGGLWYIYCS